MTVHRIKLREEYADAVYSGEKTFEIRYNDRGYQKGDEIIFKVIDGCGISVNHALNHVLFEITYLIHGIHGFGLKEDWCVFAIRRKEHE